MPSWSWQDESGGGIYTWVFLAIVQVSHAAALNEAGDSGTTSENNMLDALQRPGVGWGWEYKLTSARPREVVGEDTKN